MTSSITQVGVATSFGTDIPWVGVASLLSAVMLVANAPPNGTARGHACSGRCREVPADSAVEDGGALALTTGAGEDTLATGEYAPVMTMPVSILGNVGYACTTCIVCDGGAVT
mmetsp:Transcript_36634/g.101735  ORF Transcript_36634/g.101735 Transcript_36634/m.101735 type:complete len:113 (+) Transcript_36634:283-621(+)